MRTRKFLASLALASTILASLAGGVGAAPNEKANCIGQGSFSFAQQGVVGQNASEFAQQVGGLGQIVGPAASSNCGQ